MKLSDEDIENIRKEFKDGVKQVDLVLKYKVTKGTISKICSGQYNRTCLKSSKLESKSQPTVNPTE